MGNAGPVFQFWKSNELFKQVIGIVKLNWHLIAFILLEIVMVARCDVVGC